MVVPLLGHVCEDPSFHKPSPHPPMSPLLLAEKTVWLVQPVRYRSTAKRIFEEDFQEKPTLLSEYGNSSMSHALSLNSADPRNLTLIHRRFPGPSGRHLCPFPRRGRAYWPIAPVFNLLGEPCRAKFGGLCCSRNWHVQRRRPSARGVAWARPGKSPCEAGSWGSWEGAPRATGFGTWDPANPPPPGPNIFCPAHTSLKEPLMTVPGPGVNHRSPPRATSPSPAGSPSPVDLVDGQNHRRRCLPCRNLFCFPSPQRLLGPLRGGSFPFPPCGAGDG